MRRAGSPPPSPVIIPPECRLYIQIPGGHVFFGDLEPSSRSVQTLNPSVFIRMPYPSQYLIINDLHTFYNEDNPNIHEFRCYIPLPNGNFLIAFLENNLNSIFHSTSTIIYARVGNNTHLTGLLRHGEGYRPSWLPRLGRSG